MTIIQDTMSGAILLSVFDFVACFFVLYFISFFIRALGFLSRLWHAQAGKSARADHGAVDAKPAKQKI